MPNKTSDTTDALLARRDQLNSQLTDLRSQYAGIVGDLQTVDEEWQTALRAGEETTLLGERRRHRTAELDEIDRAITQVTSWLQEIDDELRRKVPHEQLDRDLAAHEADLVAYAELAGQLDGAHARAVESVVAAARELHGLITSVRERHAQLTGRTQQLRTTTTHLDRTDPVPAPPDWIQPLEHVLRGGLNWRLYLSSVQSRQPEALLPELARTATLAITADRKAPAR